MSIFWQIAGCVPLVALIIWIILAARSYDRDGK